MPAFSSLCPSDSYGFFPSTVQSPFWAFSWQGEFPVRQPVDARAGEELKVGTTCLFESPCIFSLCLPKSWTMFLEESLVTEKCREVHGSMTWRNRRKGANIVILYLFVLLLTKGRRLILQIFGWGHGEGMGRERLNLHLGWKSLDVLFRRSVSPVEETNPVKVTDPQPSGGSFIVSSTVEPRGTFSWPSSDPRLLCPASTHPCHAVLKLAASHQAWKLLS